MIAAISAAAADTRAPAGRLAGASVVVAGAMNVTVTRGSGPGAEHESLPLPAYRGVPVTLAQRLARVAGVASAVGETGFPGGTVRSGDVDLVAVTAKPGVSRTSSPAGSARSCTAASTTRSPPAPPAATSRT